MFIIYQQPDSAPAFRMLAPFDLQCIKACGVTFAISAVERVIAECARGNADEAQSILVNKVTARDRVPPWTFGVTDLMRNLVPRNLLS